MWSSAWMCLLWRISLIFPSLFEVKKTTTLPHCGLISPHGAVSVCCTMKWTKAKSTKHGFFRRPPTSCFSAGPQDENKNKSGDGSCLPPLVLEYSVTCDSSRTFSCKSQRRNSLTIDSDSLISLMAPYHSLRWMDVRGCARSNIVTSSPYWLNIQYECIMRHCSPHSSYIRARQNETCCCFTLCFFFCPWLPLRSFRAALTFFGVSLQLFVLISIKVLIHHSFLYVLLRKQELGMYWNVQTYKAKNPNRICAILMSWK